VRESVSDTIANRLNDPRIEGFVSVTEVDVSADLRNADVFLSIITDDEAVRRRTFMAIEHAAKHIRVQLSQRMTSKFCPRLNFREDSRIKNTLETFKIIEEAAREFKEKDAQMPEESDTQ